MSLAPARRVTARVRRDVVLRGVTCRYGRKKRERGTAATIDCDV